MGAARQALRIQNDDVFHAETTSQPPTERHDCILEVKVKTGTVPL